MPLKTFLSRLGTLQGRLLLTIGCAIVPLAVVASLNLVGVAERSRERLVGASLNTMRAIVSAVDGRLETSVASLETLALDPLLSAGDIEAFRTHAEEVRRTRPYWATIVLLDTNGDQLLNLAAPPGRPKATTADWPALRTVLETAKPHIGGIAYGPVIKQQSFGVRVPVIRDGKVRYVLTAVIRPDDLRDVLAQQQLPIDGVIAILDASYRFVARSRGQNELVGKPAAPALLELLKSGATEGWGHAATLEGVKVYSVYARSPRTGWVVAVGIPRDMVEAPVRRAYVMVGGAILFSLAAGILAAYAVARTIVRAMRELETAAEAVARGEAPRTPQTELAEIRAAGAALAEAYREREALLEEETRLRAMAETENRGKDEFLAMMGHELRNPLAGISSAVAYVERLDRLDPDSQRGFAIIRRQAQVLSRLTDDLLEVGRLFTGKIRLIRAPLDLGELVQTAVAAMRSAGIFDAHTLRIDTREAWVNGDQVRLEQILSNVLSNAVKYTPSGGVITVTVRPMAGHADLVVTDTGIGLEPALLLRVFDLFVQGERSLDRAQGGLGLGLTLVRRLVELHDGTVTARSAGHDRGTDIEVRLPRIARPADAPDKTHSPRTADQHKIALVEDNEDARLSLRLLLSASGCDDIVEAADGPTAVEVITREAPTAAVIDIGLPGFDGYEVAARVRAALGRSIRLVALTGYGSPEDRARGLDAGFDAYLLKPATGADLERALFGEAAA